jgi:hypothetical protein
MNSFVQFELRLQTILRESRFVFFVDVDVGQLVRVEMKECCD